MKVKALFAGLVLIASISLAAAAAAAGTTSTDKASAVQACTTLRTSLGASTFALTFGTNAHHTNAFAVCVSRFTRTAHAAQTSARAACAGKKGKAFAQCVQARTHSSLVKTETLFQNAARACRSELKSMGASAFATKYAKNTTAANAFGKCVSARVSHGANPQGQTQTQAPPQTQTQPQTPTEHFTVTLQGVNSSGVSGAARLTLKDDQLTVEVALAGLEANQPHSLFVGGLASGNATCPTASADTSPANGVISLSEGQPFFGSSLLDLTPVPTASASGTIAFTRVYTVNRATLLPLENRTLVVQGKTISGSYDSTVPVACGEIAG